VIVDLAKYKKEKNTEEETVRLPVFTRIFIENGKVVGELRGSCRKIILDDLKQEG
jgi:hypothetical protein